MRRRIGDAGNDDDVLSDALAPRIVDDAMPGWKNTGGESRMARTRVGHRMVLHGLGETGALVEKTSEAATPTIGVALQEIATQLIDDDEHDEPRCRSAVGLTGGEAKPRRQETR